MPDRPRDWSKYISIGISVGTSLLVLAFFFGGMMENATTKQARIDKSLIPLEDKVGILMGERVTTQALAVTVGKLQVSVENLNKSVDKLEKTITRLQEK